MNFVLYTNMFIAAKVVFFPQNFIFHDFSYKDSRYTVYRLGESMSMLSQILQFDW